MFTKKMKKAALALAFAVVSSTSANAMVGNFYAGLGADMGFTVSNSNYDDKSPYINVINPFGGKVNYITSAFGNKLTMGFEARLGYEVFLVQRLYLAGEAFARFMFDVSGQGATQGGIRASDQPYISGGLTFKIGAGFNDQKTKLYVLASSEYMSAAIGPNTPDQIGLVLVGGGIGVKQEVTSFMDLFIEAKVLFDVFSHINGIKNHFDPSGQPDGVTYLDHSGSIGYQLLNVAIGADFKF